MTPRPIPPIRPPDWLVRGAGEVAGVSLAMARSGVWRGTRPSQLVPIERALRRWGQSSAFLATAAAIRHPERAAVIDELGTTTYRQLEQRTAALAGGFAAKYGIATGAKVLVLCRNHRGPLEASLAASRLGADVLLASIEQSSDAADALADLVRGHPPDLVVADAEFAAWSEDRGLPTVLAWHDGNPAGDSLDRLAATDWPEPPDPGRAGTVTTPMAGISLPGPRSPGPRSPGLRSPGLATLAGITATTVDRAGVRVAEPMVICQPLSHGLALQHVLLALFHGSPLLLARRYSAGATLASVDRHRAGSMVVVPAMVRELADPGSTDLAPYDLASLRAVICDGSGLSPAVAERFAARFGAVLSAVYWSSEAGIVTLASPRDLAAAPGTVGRALLGTSVRIVDDEGQPVGPGITGRIVAGRTATGDRGRLDDLGRLFLAGPAQQPAE